MCAKNQILKINSSSKVSNHSLLDSIYPKKMSTKNSYSTFLHHTDEKGRFVTIKKNFQQPPQRMPDINSIKKADKVKKGKNFSSKNFYYKDTGNSLELYTTTTTVSNLRHSASLKSKIIEQVPDKANLEVLENFGQWVKVKVKKSGSVGFIYYKNIH